MNGSGTFGSELGLLTRGASLRLEYSVMFARVWQAAARVNLAVAKFIADFKLVLICFKISCVIVFIL